MPADPRYREFVRLFNRREFFACHDVLEDLWGETLGHDREFYQGLIHASVALFHFEEGNLGGARKMYDSTCRYLCPYEPMHLGLDVKEFLANLATCFADLLIATNEYPSGVRLDPQRVPLIRLQAETVP